LHLNQTTLQERKKDKILLKNKSETKGKVIGTIHRLSIKEFSLRSQTWDLTNLT
jgi:hypothetical protein